ncbi:hypothetical protein MODO_1096 [Myroides odoratimimus]|uniref:hypothetical protein n=1 Tax=Myroides odoratimimus TaxID=76832 RepID=UPI000724273F|nr:hypothetical protein [Myroides odoratimimus]MCA4806568.1 hypothetical protein [Myroides odoratimimus]GAQ13442.1 hypothetical protein MODO_1096 [Myroides odoratimimus]STZ48730.1 Uncharacterised protein [Myroides odoratimimus]
MFIWGFDRGREPLNVEEVSYEKVSYEKVSYEKVEAIVEEEEVISEDNVEELVLEEEDNGDGKRGYVYRKLVKERSYFLLDMFRIKSSYGLYTIPFDLKKHCR